MKRHGLRAFILRLAQAIAWRFGYQISREVPVEETFTMDGLLVRAARRGIQLRAVIDVGASNGKWAVSAAQHFPEAAFLLVEPLAERAQALAALKAARPQFDHALCALGEKSGEVSFHVAEDLDGIGIGGPGAPTPNRTVPICTLDQVVRERSLRGPFLLKLDTHGFELPILAGAKETLPEIALLIIEVYNFQIADCALRFHEMCAHVEKLGFRCYDLADPMLRVRDAALWQMDFAFLRHDHPLWESNTYR